MKITKRQLRRIIKEMVMDNIDLGAEDADLSSIAEHFGYQKSGRSTVIRQNAPVPEPLGSKEYEIIDPPRESGLRLITDTFAVSKYYNFKKWMFAVRINGQRRNMYLGPFRSLEKVIEYLEENL